MRTSHNDSVKDPRTTAITINEEALHKEEFEFKSQTKTERALKTLQRLSGLTTLLSTYQLIPMTLSLANDPSSFNIISTSLASTSLLLSLGLAYWSTRVLKSEQSRHLLAQDLNWEGLNTGLFITLLMRAALSLVLIPNMLLQSGNTPSQMVDSGLTTSQINMARTISNLSVPLPLIELMVFFVFLSAAKTTFSHIKQSGRAMSSLIFFANIAMMSTALGLVFSVLRLKSFPFQGNFALIFPSWNLNGLLRLGAITSFISFVVWLVNFKRWRVPSVFSTLIVGALVLGFTALSISGYSNARSVEREHGPEFAHPYLGFSNLGMLSAVFGMLVFLGGSYFWQRHYNFIETSRKRNLAGFAVLVGFVLIFAAARTFHFQPFVTSNQGFSSTRTYTNVEAKIAPQMTIREAMLTQYMLNDLNSLDKGIKDTTKDLNNVITLFENAKRRGFFPEELTTQLWSFTESVDNYEGYVPKAAAMELFQLFGSFDNLQNQLEDASEGVSENSRAIRNYALQLWPWSKSLPEESEDYKDILPNSGVVSQLYWSLFKSLDDAQASIDDAKAQLESTKAVTQDAQNKALIAGDAGTTEFWPWSSSADNLEGYKNIIPEDAVNQLWWFFNKVSTVHTKLKEAATEVRGTTKAIANATTSLWPSRMAALSDYRNYVPREQELQLWWLSSSVEDVKDNLNDVSTQLNETLELWSPWANSLRNYKTHEEVIPQNVSRLWSLFGSVNKTEESLNVASEKASNTKASIEEAQSKGVLPTEKTVETWSSNWQDNLPSRMVTTTWFSGWHDAEVSENLTQDGNITQLWGDHWSVVDKLPSFLRLRSAPTSQPVWNSDYVTEFPREAATQLFLWFGKANAVDNAVNAAKAKVQETKAVLDTAQTKGLISADNVTLSQEQLTALWELFGKAKDSVQEASEQFNETTLATANTELFPWSDSLNEYDQYKEALPKIALTEFFSFFGSSSDLQESLTDSAQQIQTAQSQEVWNDALAEKLPKDISTQLFSLFGVFSGASDQLNEANSKMNSMNSMMTSAQNLGLVSKDANVKPTSLTDAASKLNSLNNIKTSAQNLGIVKKDTSGTSTPTTTATTASTTTTKTGDVGGSLNSLQNQLNSASQKVSNIQSIYSNAQNLGLISKQNTATPSQLWTVSGALNSVQSSMNNANQKLYAAKNIYSGAQNLGVVSKNTAPTELYAFWGSLNEAQDSINQVNQDLDTVQNTASTTPNELWSFSETLDKSEEYVPKTTELLSFSSSLSSIQSQINTANQKVSNMKSIYGNAQNLGVVSKQTPSQLWEWSKAVDTVDKYREYLPVETVALFWDIFGSVSNLTDVIDDTNKQFQVATEKGALPAPNVTETWTADWIDKVPKESATQLFVLWNTLSNVQSSINNANQKVNNAKSIYSSAQSLGVAPKSTPASTSGASQLWGWSDDLKDTVVPSQLWWGWSSLNDAENAAKDANENLDNIEAAYQNATTESETTELFSLFGWFTGAQSNLNTANQKLANVQTIYNNAQNLGLVNKDNAASNQLFDFSGSLNSIQNQLSAANRKVSNIQSISSNAQSLGLVNRPGSSTTQLFSLFGWLTGTQSSLNSASQKLSNVQTMVNSAQNLGLVSKTAGTTTTANTPTPAPTTELFFLWNWLTGAQNSLNTANQKLANVQNMVSNAQNLGLVSKDGSTGSTTTTTTTNTPTTELFSWFTNSVNSAQASLNTANQKLSNVQSVVSNAKNLGLISKDNAPQTTELFFLWNWLTGAQSSLNTANQKVTDIKNIVSNAQNLGLVSKDSSTTAKTADTTTPNAPTTEMFAWLSTSMNKVQGSLNTANQKVSNVKSLVSNAQNLGLVSKDSTTPQTTELFFLWNWLTGAQNSLNTANQKVTDAKNIVTNAQNLGLISKDSSTGSTTTTPASTTATPSELWTLDDTLNKYEEHVPKTTALWSLFGWLTGAQSSLNTANQKIANVQSMVNNAQNLGLIKKDGSSATTTTTETTASPSSAPTTQLLAWFGKSVDSAQASLNEANQKLANAKSIYNNAQNLGLVSKDNAAAPPAETTELFFLWNWLTGAQNSLNSANQKLANAKNIVSSAQNLGLVSKDTSSSTPTDASASTTTTTTTPTPASDSLTELFFLWNWLTGAQNSLNTANQKLANVQSVVNNAQNLGLVSKDGSTTTPASTSTTTATPSELWSASQTLDDTMSKYEEYVPKTMTMELWPWMTNSLNNAQASLNTANQKLNAVQNVVSNAKSLGLVSKENTATTTPPAEITELFFLWNWLTGAQNSLNTANQKVTDAKNIVTNAQNLGLINKDSSTGSTTTTPASTTATPSELWTLDGTLNKYEEYVPKTTELFLWFSNSLNKVQSQLNTANQQVSSLKNTYSSAENLGKSLGLANKQGTATNNAAAATPEITEMFAWLTNSLNNVQSSLNTASQKASNVKSLVSNAQNLGLVSKQGDSTTATPQITELFFLWNWLTGAQSSLNNANQKLANVKNIVSNAQNLGLVSKDSSSSSSTTTTTPTDASANPTTATPSELWQALDDTMDKYEEYVPKTTELWPWMTNSLNNAQASLNQANQKLANVQNVYSNAQNLGLVSKQGTATPSELWSASQTLDDTMSKYEEYVPKTTELFLWFSNSLNKVQSQLNTANQQVSSLKNTYSSAENLGKSLGLANKQGTATNNAAAATPEITEMFAWFTNSLNNVQSSLNTASQKVSNVKSAYSNAQNLGLIGEQAATPSTTVTPSELWSASQSFDDALNKYEEYVPKTVQLFSLFGWLSGAQTSLNNVNQKVTNVKSIYTNAQNLGLVSKTGTNTNANANAGTTATPTTTTTTATPSQLWDWSQPLDKLDDAGVIPKEVIVELLGIFDSLSDLQVSVQDANKQIEESKIEYLNSKNKGELTPEAETKLWWGFGSLAKVENSLNNATAKIENAQNNGIIPSRDNVDDYNAEWLDKISDEGATQFWWSFFSSVDNLRNSLNETKDQIQGVKVTYQGAQDEGLVGKEGELTRLFWPFTRPKSNLEIAKETVQEKAKIAYDAVASAANTSQEKVKSAYNAVSNSVSSSAAELKVKAQELANQAQGAVDHVKVDVDHTQTDIDHARTDSDHVNKDSDTVQGKNKNQAK